MSNQAASLQTEPIQRRKSWLPYGRQWIDEADIQAVVAVLQSEYLTTGPQIEHFERKLALKVGASYAVAFSNGTAALHAACGRRMAERGVSVVVGVRGVAEELVKAAREGGVEAIFVSDAEAAGEWMQTNVRAGDAVLLKASRGVRLERALAGLAAESPKANAS